MRQRFATSDRRTPVTKSKSFPFSFNFVTAGEKCATQRLVGEFIAERVGGGSVANLIVYRQKMGFPTSWEYCLMGLFKTACGTC